MRVSEPHLGGERFDVEAQLLHNPEQIVKKLRDGEAMLNTRKDLAALLQSLERGVPGAIRSPTTAPSSWRSAFRPGWAACRSTPLYVDHGSPWKNGYAESFHSKLVDEFLSPEQFEGVTAARRQPAAWKDDYNHDRPHSLTQPAHS